MTTTYVVMRYWTGSYCSGWVEACEKKSLSEAEEYIKSYIEPLNESFKIIQRQEVVVAEHYDKDLIKMEDKKL